MKTHVHKESRPLDAIADWGVANLHADSLRCDDSVGVRHDLNGA